MQASAISSGSAPRNCAAFMRDYVLLGLVIYAFSLAVIAQAQSSSQEVHNASIAIVDEDHSAIVAADRSGISAALLPEAAADRRTRHHAGDEQRTVYLRARYPAKLSSVMSSAGASPRSSSMSMRRRWCKPASAPITRSRSS